MRWLGCVVCGDDSEFVPVADHLGETEVMCTRCGQARLVPVLARASSDGARASRAS